MLKQKPRPPKKKKKMKDGCVAFAMVLGPGGMDWNTVSCNTSVFIELLHDHFFTHNDWVETSFHFIKKKDGWSCCPCNCIRSRWNGLKYCFLQCIRLHLITACPFSHPQRLGGNFISFYRFGDCFSHCTHPSFHCVRHYYFNLWLQLAIFLPRCSLLLILAMATIFIFLYFYVYVAYMGWNNHFSFHGIW